jgi:phosphoribosylformylglycinamidine synthase
MTKPRVLIVRAPGTNCDEETSAAWQLAGARPETWHINRLIEAPRALDQFQVLNLPGGFSYGDDLGAGRILAVRLATVLADAVLRLRDRGGFVIGICNGFQVLVRSGLLPGRVDLGPATLAPNASGHFEDRWVRMRPAPGKTPLLPDLEPIDAPSAHGEGRFLMSLEGALDALEASGQVVLRYVDNAGAPTEAYPANPNGSPRGIAGVCDPTGRILGLMPHPERNVLPTHHPLWTRAAKPLEGNGLRFFRNAVAALR